MSQYLGAVRVLRIRARHGLPHSPETAHLHEEGTCLQLRWSQLHPALHTTHL